MPQAPRRGFWRRLFEWFEGLKAFHGGFALTVKSSVFTQVAVSSDIERPTNKPRDAETIASRTRTSGLYIQ